MTASGSLPPPVSAQRRRRGPLGWLGLGVGILVAIVVVVVVGAYLFLQTGTGKTLLARELTGILSGPQSRIEIRDISGSVPFDMGIGSVRLADGAGEWLAVDDIRVAISAGDLLRRRLTIRSLSAASLTLSRLPAAPAASPPAPAGPPSLDIPVPKLPVDIDLQKLSVPVIDLGAPLLGQAARLSLAGKFGLVGGRADTSLDLERTDAIPGAVKLALVYDGDRLDADLSVSEPTGMVLAQALGRDDKLPVLVTLTGHGPLVGWKGRIEARAGDAAQPAARLQADLGLDQKGQRLAMTLNGDLAARPLLPANLAGLIGDHALLGLAASIEGTRTEVERLRLTLAAATVDATAALDSASKALSASVTATVPDLASASGLAGAPLAGAVRLSVLAGGATDRPTLAIDLGAKGLVYGGYRIEALTLGAKAATTAALDDKAVRYTLDLTGHAEALAGGPIPGDLSRSLDLRLVGESDATVQNVVVRQLALTGAGIALTGDAHRAGDDVAGTLSARLDDLSRFAALAKLPLAGSVTVDARLGEASLAAAGAAKGTLQIHGSNLRTGIPVADALLAGRLDLATDLSRSTAGAFGLSNLKASAGNFSLSGDGHLDGLAADAPVGARLRLEIPRLAPVGAAVKSPLQGAAVLTAAVTGARDTPALKADLTGTGLEAGGVRIDRLLATLEASGMAAPQGRLEATLEGGTLPGRVAIRFALKDQLLSLPTIDLALGGATVSGALDVALATDEASGHVAAHLPDLARFSDLAGTPLAGRIDLDARLSRGGRGGQGADITLEGAGIASGEAAQRVAVDRVKLVAQLQNLLGKATATAALDVGKVEAGTTTIAGLTLRLTTPQPGTLAFTASTSGDFGKAFRVSLGGTATLDGKRQQLRLATLDGMVASEPLKLTRPLTVTHAPDGTAVEGLALTLGTGSVTGGGSLRGQAIAGQVQARALSLAFLAGFGNVRNVSGTLSIDGAVSGTLAAPTGRLALATRDFRMAPGEKALLPAVSLSVEARLQPGTVSLTGQVSTPTKDAVSFSGSLPFASAGGNYSVPPDGALSLKATGSGRLENLEELLPLGEDQVAGPFSLALAVSGTVASPQAGGSLTISGGRYTNQALGTELDRIDLELVGEGRRFIIRKLTATDGVAGQLATSGAVDLGAKPAPTVDIKANLTHFLIAHSDLATATAGGQATVSGTLAAPRVFARFTVEGADIAIPQKLPPSVVDLNVVVVDSRVKRGDAPLKPAPSAPAIPATLDLAIDMPGKIFVRGDGVDSEWRGRIAVTGTSVAPVVDLRLETVRGTVSVLSKTFTITQGLVRIAPGSLDPMLDLIAEATTSNITATVHFTGTPTAPKITLSSVPVVPQDEILSQVLFGKSLGQMTTGEGLQLAAAAGSLASGGPGLLDRLRTATGLDRLGFGNSGAATGNAAAGGLNNTTLSGGRYITDNVYLNVEQGASTSSTKVEVQVEILPHLSVDSAVGANSSSSIGAKWKYDY